MVIDSAYRTIAVFEMIHQLTNYTRVKYRPRKFVCTYTFIHGSLMGHY